MKRPLGSGGVSDPDLPRGHYPAFDPSRGSGAWFCVPKRPFDYIRKPESAEGVLTDTPEHFHFWRRIESALWHLAAGRMHAFDAVRASKGPCVAPALNNEGIAADNGRECSSLRRHSVNSFRRVALTYT